jgi:hypothetical protein
MATVIRVCRKCGAKILSDAPEGLCTGCVLETALGIFPDAVAAGGDNIAIGLGAGTNITTGSSNIAIGTAGPADESATTRIGGAQTRTFISGIHDTAVTGLAVVVSVSGQLGVVASSARFKAEIKSMDNASEAIFGLKPVVFRYKREIDPAGTSQFGLVAEDVEKINPDLVVRDKDGEIYTVRYDAVNAMLLNEFLKEHRKVEKLEATIAQQRNDFQATITELKKEIDSVIARSKEQDTKIQRVTAQVELNRSEPRTVSGGYW